jgi:hypothetical protein
MLMKLTPWVNLTNILRAAFRYADHKSVKKTDCLNVFFALSGSAGIKALNKMLVKSTPGGCFGEVMSIAFLSTSNFPILLLQLEGLFTSILIDHIIGRLLFKH